MSQCKNKLILLSKSYQKYTNTLFATTTVKNVFFLPSSCVLFFSLFVVVPSRRPYVYVNKKHPGVDSINISIYPIEEKYQNGKLLGYNIWYETSCYRIPKSSGQVNVSASTRSHIITGLQPGTKYRIRVAGFTSKGTGPYDSEYVFTSKCPFVGVVICLI